MFVPMFIASLIYKSQHSTVISIAVTRGDQLVIKYESSPTENADCDIGDTLQHSGRGYGPGITFITLKSCSL